MLQTLPTVCQPLHVHLQRHSRQRCEHISGVTRNKKRKLAAGNQIERVGDCVVVTYAPSCCWQCPEQSHKAPFAPVPQPCIDAAGIAVLSKALYHICTIFVPYLYLIETTRHRKYTQQLRCSVPVCTLHTHLFWIRVSCKLHNSWLLLWQDCDMIRLLMTRGGSLCDLRIPTEQVVVPVCVSHTNAVTQLQYKSKTSQNPEDWGGNARPSNPCF